MSRSSEVSILAFLAVFTAASAGRGSARVSASPSMNQACVVQGQCQPRAPRGTRWKRPNRLAGQGGASQKQHETRVRGPPRRGGGRQRLRPAAAGQCSARRAVHGSPPAAPARAGRAHIRRPRRGWRRPRIIQRVYCKRATAGTPFPDPQTWAFRPAQPLPKRRHPLHRAAATEHLSSASFPRTVIGWASPSRREE